MQIQLEITPSLTHKAYMEFTQMESLLSMDRQNFNDRDFANFLQKLQEFARGPLTYEFNMLDIQFQNLMRHRDILRNVSLRWNSAENREG